MFRIFIQYSGDIKSCLRPALINSPSLPVSLMYSKHRVTCSHNHVLPLRMSARPPSSSLTLGRLWVDVPHKLHIVHNDAAAPGSNAAREQLISLRFQNKTKMFKINIDGTGPGSGKPRISLCSWAIWSWMGQANKGVSAHVRCHIYAILSRTDCKLRW